MKIIQQIQSDNFSNIFLYIAFMFANIDYVGLADYSIKAVLGALIWYAVKLLHDRYLINMRKKIYQKNREEKRKRLEENKTIEHKKEEK